MKKECETCVYCRNGICRDEACAGCFEDPEHANYEPKEDKSQKWYLNWECDDEIICPYCGKHYEPTYEETYIGGKDVDCYKEGEQGKFACDRCGKKFRLSAEMKWEYTTETINGEMTEKEHYDMDDFLV